MAELGDLRFRIDVRSGQIWRDDDPIPLTNKAFQLLCYFVENPNQILSKADILDHIWPDLNVSESLVREYVHDIRVALSDASNAPTFIETVRGRGYRYLGGIERATKSISQNSGPPRIVILPWQRGSDADRLDLFGRGFSSELLTLLAKNRDLAVIAKSSALTLANQTDQIGRARHELHADYAIEGEIFPADAGVRLALNAVNTETETIIWSDSFTVPEIQLFSFETELVPRVAAAIGAHSGPILRDATMEAKRRLPTNLSAFEQYLLALDAYGPHTTPGMVQAKEYVECGLRKDPGHAQSWLLLSYVFEHLANYGSLEEADEYTAYRFDAVGRAAELDQLDGRILIEYGDCLYLDGDEEGSLQSYIKAYEMNRGASDVLTLVAKYLAGVICNENEARSALQVAHNLNPVGDYWLSLNELRTLYILGDLDAAIRVGDGCPDTPMRSVFVALCFLEKGQIDNAYNIIKTAAERHADFEPMRFASHYYIREPRLNERYLSGLNRLSSYMHQRQLRAI